MEQWKRKVVLEEKGWGTSRADNAGVAKCEGRSVALPRCMPLATGHCRSPCDCSVS